MTGAPLDMSIFTMLRQRMDMLGERQRVVAQNVANVSTPGFTPQDVDMGAFNAALMKGQAAQTNGVHMSMTNAGHIAGASRAPLAAGVMLHDAPDSETTLDGNSVVVEEQMMKVAETRMEFEAMTGLYNKSLNLMRIAIKSPG